MPNQYVCMCVWIVLCMSEDESNEVGNTNEQMMNDFQLLGLCIRDSTRLTLHFRFFFLDEHSKWLSQIWIIGSCFKTSWSKLIQLVFYRFTFSKLYAVNHILQILTSRCWNADECHWKQGGVFHMQRHAARNKRGARISAIVHGLADQQSWRDICSLSGWDQASIWIQTPKSPPKIVVSSTIT